MTSSNIERVRDDVRNGGKMGKSSSLRLLAIVAEQQERIDALERKVQELWKARSEGLAGYPGYD